MAQSVTTVDEVDYEPGSLHVHHAGVRFHIADPIPDDVEFCEIEHDSDRDAMWITWYRPPTYNGALAGTIFAHADEVLIRELRMRLSMDNVRTMNPAVWVDNRWMDGF